MVWFRGAALGPLSLGRAGALGGEDVWSEGVESLGIEVGRRSLDDSRDMFKRCFAFLPVVPLRCMGLVVCSGVGNRRDFANLEVLMCGVGGGGCQIVRNGWVLAQILSVDWGEGMDVLSTSVETNSCFNCWVVIQNFFTLPGLKHKI